MSDPVQPDAAHCQLRVLIVENDPPTRKRFGDLLALWGFFPVMAQGAGDALIEDALRKAARYRCQLALVDMRLRDDHDPRDFSGLELIERLRPTASIILSGIDDRRAATAAVVRYGAINFVGKEDTPEELQQAIESAATGIGSCRHHAEIVWPHELSSPRVRDLLFPDQREVPDDEADELIGRLFRRNHRVVLTLIGDDHETPSGDGPITSEGSPLRRRSRVFRARVDDRAAYSVVKLARRERIAHELQHFEQYVAYGLPNLNRPVKEGEVLLWDMGVIAYSYVGGAGMNGVDGPQTFKEHYRSTADVSKISVPLVHFFSADNWGVWYQNHPTLISTSLFSAYDATWGGVLSNALLDWATEPERLAFPGLTVELPNPTRWVAEHARESYQVIRPRQTVTHGDLHGDNLFVHDGRAWPLDFERTGPGPILRDFVELVQDVLTRLARFSEADTPVLFELALAICAPPYPTSPMQLPTSVKEHPEAYKAFQVVEQIQQLAASCARYEDRLEYLWGLLLNNLFVARLLPPGPRRSWTLLLAAVICERLSQGGRPQRVWPPPRWPFGGWSPADADLLARAPQPAAHQADGVSSKSGFAGGHALVVGVGGDLPGTLDDAQALAGLLTDARRCAYPAQQVELLVGEQATRVAVLAGLDRLIAAARHSADATVIVYFSGHGVRAPGSYLLTSGWALGDLAESAVSGEEFTEKLKAIRARRLLVLLDCCHAGAMTGVGATKQALQKAPLPAELEQLQVGSGRVVIASSQRDELSYAGKPYSAFTRALIEALSGSGAAEHDGYARVADIATYVSATVAVRTGDRQHPVLRFDRIDNFAVAYYAGGAKMPLPLELP